MYTVGSYRLYELPANGVMQISDGNEYLNTFFEEGNEIIGYASGDEPIGKIRYYLSNDAESIRIARNAYRCVMRDYRVGELLLHRAGSIIRETSR